VAFAGDPDRERLVGERRLLVLHRPGPHPDHPGGQCLDVKPNFRQRVSQQAILLVTEAAAPTANQLVLQCPGAEISDRYTQQWIDVLERNVTDVAGDDSCKGL